MLLHLLTHVVTPTYAGGTALSGAVSRSGGEGQRREARAVGPAGQYQEGMDSRERCHVLVCIYKHTIQYIHGSQGGGGG